MLLTWPGFTYDGASTSLETQFMQASHPYDFHCGFCGFIRKETIEKALSGRLDPPVWCPDCRHPMQLDDYDVEKEAKKAGLIPIDD